MHGGLHEGSTAAGHFVWISDGKGGYDCQRWPTDLASKRPEPITAYPLTEEQMTWPLNRLAVLFPPPTRLQVGSSKIKIS